MKRYYYILLYLIVAVFVLIYWSSCRYSNDSFIDETPAYMKTNPDCIVGVYYNHYTDGSISYIKIQPDSTFVHVFKNGDINYIDSNTWTYEYNNGQNDIVFNSLKLLPEEGGDDRRSTYCVPLLDCIRVDISDKDEKLSFYKASNIK